MTNKYLEKAATVVIRRRLEEGLPKSKFNLTDEHAGRLAAETDEWAGIDKRAPYLRRSMGIGALGGGTAGAAAAAMLSSPRNRLTNALFALGGGALAGAIGGNIYAQKSREGKRLYGEGVDESSSRPIPVRAGIFTDGVLSGLRDAYPSSGDYGTEDRVAVPIDTKGSVLYIRPSVLENLRDQYIRDAENQMIASTAAAGASTLDERPDYTRATVNLMMAGRALGDRQAAVSASNNKYLREIAESVRREMQYL